jgi:molybdate transport system ATP-binding protein
MISHFAIHITNAVNKNLLQEQLATGSLLPEFGSLKGDFFSVITLQHYIDEEIRHERCLIQSDNGQKVSSMSEGEQKKALLNHLLKTKPDYLIVDNIFDNLDPSSQIDLLDSLNRLSDTLRIVQLFNRNADLLPFIKTIYTYEKNSLIPFEKTVRTISAEKVNLPQAFLPVVLTEKSLVRLENVSVEFDGKKVLNSISWEIKAGEFWQLKGPNGSGKSTLLALITGDSPKGYNQELFLFGKKKGSGETVWEIKQKIGYFTSNMIQQFSRYDSVENMILSGFFDSVGLYVKPIDRHRRLAAEWLLLVGLHEKRQQPFLDLSMGHQRLVLVARAMVKHPPLLILDEPTVGLDESEVVLFTSLVHKIAQSKTAAILYVSHRKEKGLEPDFIYELIPGNRGSVGKQSD